MLKLKSALTLPAAGLSGFEVPLTDVEIATQQAVHRFAKDVMRPIGQELDRKTAEQVIAPDSPLYQVFVEAAALGLSAEPEGLSQDVAIRLESLVGEELGWGDAGLAVALGVAGFPMLMAQALGNQELIDLCTDRIGCWMATQPDRGSDNQIFDMKREWPEGVPPNKGNLLARVGKDDIVINGQCSAWVSNGPIAQVSLAYMVADYGKGYFDADGLPNGVAMILPLDLPGITKGKPLDKIGQRALPQGEIYLDNVRIPKRFAVALQDDYYGNLCAAWSHAGTHMSNVFTGVARAAFEMTLNYCHERRQGGRLLIDNALTRYRIGDMLRRVELARSVARRFLAYARLSPASHPYVTASAKVTVTEEAMKVVSEAFQLLGGNATSREYPVEKLFRDAKAALIEDGENYVLTMRLGLLCQQLFEQGWARN